VLTQISVQSFKKLHIVWGMVKDKDIFPVLNLLPKEANYYFCQANIPRAMEAEDLAQKAATIGLAGLVVKNVNEALAKARNNASADDFIFIGGSTFVVAEIENL
jgi:dihydrofolate synthase/folylpolyglutamate synthase